MTRSRFLQRSTMVLGAVLAGTVVGLLSGNPSRGAALGSPQVVYAGDDYTEENWPIWWLSSVNHGFGHQG